jgi:GrpB-like predicted nucleotidyltransferase (UPF0157 family)
MGKAVIGPYECHPPACCDYDPRGTRVARRVARLISGRLPAVVVEHIGSTAVPGCAGKGIIDLMVLYPEGQLEAVKELLASLGFQRQKVGHLFPESRPMRVGALEHEGHTFRLHVHVVAVGSSEVAQVLAFRDRLRTDPKFRAAYVERKRQILATGVTDPAAYTGMKSVFVSQALTPPSRSEPLGRPTAARPD